MGSTAQKVTIPARDGYELAATVHGEAGVTDRCVALVNSAMGVPARFYRHFAHGLVDRGLQVVTWDYRGIGESLRGPLAQSEATILCWATVDLAGVIDWIRRELEPRELVLFGHSVGGQMAGLLEDPSPVSAMVGLSAQSGYWKLQGGLQKVVVALHGHLTMPLLTRMYGYAPLSKIGVGEDLPPRVALTWARWLRDPEYLFGDTSLPLERYQRFTAPILGYSFSDDAWGTRRSVDELLAHYPEVERRHVTPGEFGLEAIGHVGYFRPGSERLWDDTVAWLQSRNLA